MPSRKLTYFDKDELNSWLLQRRVRTSDEIDVEAARHLVFGNKISKNGRKHAKI
jgi:hypothetical protein